MSLEETLQRLPPGAVAFARELLDHHWSEAAWLYARREVLALQGALLSSDQWLEIEARAEAHVIALAHGERLVLDECPERIEDGDAGELHTAMRVLCRAERASGFDAAIDVIEWPSPARAAAVADALAWDAPDAWQELVAAVLADEGAPEDALGPLATVAGLRGWPLGDLLVGALEDRVGDLAAIIAAVGRLQVREAMPVLSELISDAGQPGEVRCAAAIAAAGFDARAVAAYAGQLVGVEAWAAVPLAMTGGPEAAEVLAAAFERGPRAPDLVLAIGLLGRVDGIPLLLRALDDEAIAEAAAEALYLYTGAALHEEGSLVEEVERDDDDEGEDEGEDDRVDAARVGLPVVRLSRSRARWTEHIETRDLASIGASRRLRLGVPFDPSRVLEELGRTSLRPELREQMATELAVRYRLPRWWSPRLLVSKQRQALARMKIALAEHAKLEPGAWVVNGVAHSGHRTNHPLQARRP